MEYIKGKITYRGEKWFTVDLFDKKGYNYLLIDRLTDKLNVGDVFSFWVVTNKKQYDNRTKWFHIATSYKKRVTIGFDMSVLALQPIIGNIYVKGKRVYNVKSCKKRDNGLSYGYDTEYWWELSCDDITETSIGKKALSEIL